MLADIIGGSRAERGWRSWRWRRGWPPLRFLITLAPTSCHTCRLHVVLRRVQRVGSLDEACSGTWSGYWVVLAAGLFMALDSGP